MSTDRPDDVDAEFARLVADYDTPPDPPEEGIVSGRPWPASEDVSEAGDSSGDAGDPVEPEPFDPDEDALVGGGLAVSETDPLNTEATWEDEGHFVPPPPPPLPRLEPLTLLAWIGVLASVGLAILSALFAWTIPDLVLGAMIVGFVGGIVVLIARLSREPPDPDRPDDGAVV
jgi:hypothetical protein